MRILIASSICPNALATLRRNHDVVCAINGSQAELCSAIADREVLVFRSGVDINQTVLSCGPDLKLLIRAGSGLDNLDFEYSQQRGLTLVRIPEPGAQAVAELAFGMMIHLARQIGFNDRQLRDGHWTKQSTTGYVLRNKVLGIVGAGNIGSRVGEMGTAWGMRAIGCVENPALADTAELSRKGIRITDFEEVVRSADFLSIHVPKDKSTLNLINAEVLSWMKPTSFLVNLSRGGIVDEIALLDALNSGTGPAGAGLDVHQNEGEGKISPLASLPNVVLTPHIGASTVDTMREIGERVIDTIKTFQSQTDRPLGSRTSPVTETMS
jgi:phosphoglycerate dehydrogenase-like enzyme